MNMLSNRRPYTDIALLLCLTLLLAQTASAQFTGNAWSEFSVNGEVVGAKAVCADNDIDNDNDGLIELCYLEDVNAIRYNAEGTSYKSSNDDDATGVVTGCGGGGSNDKCFGYELVRDLDFNDDDSYESTSTNNVKVNWTTGEGWQPIGAFRHSFNSIFEGNGHTISNLRIKRSSINTVGLFSQTDNISKISNIGLLNVSIKAKNDTGGLVGFHSGSIANSYVTGSVKGIDYIGGLIGWFDNGSITNSYASGSVKGNASVGGLVGDNSGSITNSYASGSVDGNISVGGLIGWNSNKTANGYATGSVAGSFDVGGLIGYNDGNTANIYWDTETSRISTSARGIGKTTVELQTPTEMGSTTTEIYYGWSTDNWDFGTSSQYPILKYARGDADNPACGTSQQPACGALLGRQRNNQPVITSPTTNTEIPIRSNDAGTIKTIPVAVSDNDVNDKLTLLLSAEDEDQNLVVLETTKAEVLPSGNADRGINEDLRIRIPQTIIFGMTTLRLVAEDDSGFGNAMSEPVLFKVRVANIPPTITPISNIILPNGTSTTLNVVIEDADGDPISVQLDSSDSTVATATIVATDNANYTLKITALRASTATITVMASDDKGGGAEAMFTILVDAEPSGTVSIAFNAINANTWRLTATNNVMDANGIAETNYQWFRNDTAIPGATANTYPIPNNNTGRDGGTEYKVEVSFVDNIGQLVTTSSNIYTVANQAPVINAISQTAVNEGGTVSINPTVNDANRDRLTYTWRVTSGDSTPSILASVPKTNRRIRFNVPADWIDNPSTATGVTKTLYLEIKATEMGDGGLSATRTAEVVVTKKNNGPSTIQPKIDRDEKILTLSTSTLESAIAKDPDGGDINNANVSYQWQRCQSSCSSLSSWMPISGRTGSTYTIPGNEPEGNRFRIKISYTDAQGYSNTIYSKDLPASANADIRVRAKVFLEGPLQ